MSHPMTTPDLAAIEARWAATTPGPWKAYPALDLVLWWAVGTQRDNRLDQSAIADVPPMHPKYGGDAQANAQAIAHAPTDITALIAALRASEEARGRLEAVLERYAYDCESCMGMGTVAGRMAQGSPPCKVCEPARRALQGEEAGV